MFSFRPHMLPSLMGVFRLIQRLGTAIQRPVSSVLMESSLFKEKNRHCNLCDHTSVKKDTNTKDRDKWSLFWLVFTSGFTIKFWCCISIEADVSGVLSRVWIIKGSYDWTRKKCNTLIKDISSKMAQFVKKNMQCQHYK